MSPGLTLCKKSGNSKESIQRRRRYRPTDGRTIFIGSKNINILFYEMEDKILKNSSTHKSSSKIKVALGWKLKTKVLIRIEKNIYKYSYDVEDVT